MSPLRIEEQIAEQVEAIECCTQYLKDAKMNRDAAPWLFDEESISFARQQIEFSRSLIAQLKRGRVATFKR